MRFHNWVLLFALSVSGWLSTVLLDRDFYTQTKIGTLDQCGPVFVFFHSPRCGWCIRMHGDWAALYQRMEHENVMIAQVDVTTEQELAHKFQITSYPTLLLFDVDGIVYQHTGGRDVDTLTRFALGQMTRPRYSVQFAPDETA